MKYQIWDKRSNVITPSGEVFTPQEWMERYPFAKIPEIELVISAGTINGAFCGEYTSFAEMYDEQMRGSGIEEYKNGIPEGLSPQNTLLFIEEFENAMSNKAKLTVSTEERIAAALEAQVMLAMPDEEV